MVLGIFFLIVFIGLSIFFYKLSNDIPKWWTRLCVTVVCSFLLTALITFGAAKELASLKFLFS
jgi:hypothetical protein